MVQQQKQKKRRILNPTANPNARKKYCTRCGKKKWKKKFGFKKRSADGYQSWCKDCKRDYNRSHRQTKKDPMPNQMMKICGGPICKGKGQPLEAFQKNKARQDGLQDECRICVAFRDANRDRNPSDPNQTELSFEEQIAYDEMKKEVAEAVSPALQTILDDTDITKEADRKARFAGVRCAYCKHWQVHGTARTPEGRRMGVCSKQLENPFARRVLDNGRVSPLDIFLFDEAFGCRAFIKNENFD